MYKEKEKSSTSKEKKQTIQKETGIQLLKERS